MLECVVSEIPLQQLYKLRRASPKEHCYRCFACNDSVYSSGCFCHLLLPLPVVTCNSVSWSTSFSGTKTDCHSVESASARTATRGMIFMQNKLSFSLVGSRIQFSFWHFLTIRVFTDLRSTETFRTVGITRIREFKICGHRHRIGMAAGRFLPCQKRRGVENG